MRRFSLFQAVPLSFFSRDLYQDVARAWRGAGIAYLLVLVALLTLLTLVRMQLAINGWVKGDMGRLASQVPRIVIRHRVVEVDHPMPFAIRDPSKGGVAFAIVDTTGQITSLEGQDAPLLLNTHTLVFRKSVAESRTFDLSTVKNFTIDSARCRQWLRVLAAWAAPVSAPFIFVGFLIFRVIQQVLLASIGLVVARGMRTTLDFTACMRLAAVALTPALVIEPLLELAKARPPGWAVLWIVMVLGCMVWAVSVNRSTSGARTRS